MLSHRPKTISHEARIEMSRALARVANLDAGKIDDPKRSAQLLVARLR
jgi:hypothetical protein